MGRVYSSAGQIILVDDVGHKVWASNLAPVNMLPDANRILKTNYSLSWPDFAKANAYGFDKSSSGGGSTTCASFITVRAPQEYSSSAIVLGTVPVGVNHIIVEVNLTRTKDPSPYLTTVIPPAIAEGKTLLLDGGSAIVEMIGPWRRSFDIVLSGTQVLLTLRQSVYNGGNAAPWNANNAVKDAAGGYKKGWTWGISPTGHIVALRETKGPSGNIEKWRGGGNQCSLADNTDYSCIWKGAITITPAYIPA